MKLKITEDSIRTLKRRDGEAQTDYHDAELPGFGVRVQASGKVFRVSRRDADGKIRRETIGTWRGDPAPGHDVMSVRDARELARTKLGDIVKPEYQARRAQEGTTLRQALEHHLAKMGDAKRSSESMRSYEGIEKHFADYLDRPLVNLTVDAVDEVIQNMLAGARRVPGSNAANAPGRAQANKLLRMLSTIWTSWSKRHREFTAPNPCTALERVKLEKSERVIADLPGWLTLLEAKNPSGEYQVNAVRRDLHMFSLLTGVRSDGLCHLRWDHVDDEREMILIMRAKGNKPYVIPMTERLREILDRRERENEEIVAAHAKCEGWVFPSPDSGEGCVSQVRQDIAVYDARGNVTREIRLDPPQVRRATYNTVAESIGCDQPMREKLMNHNGQGVNAAHYVRGKTLPDNWKVAREWAVKIQDELHARLHAKSEPKAPGRKRGTKRHLKSVPAAPVVHKIVTGTR